MNTKLKTKRNHRRSFSLLFCGISSKSSIGQIGTRISEHRRSYMKDKQEQEKNTQFT